MANSDVPRLIVNEKLRALRAEANISWCDLNNLWTMTCNFFTALPNHVLLDYSLASKSEQDTMLMDLISDILSSGLFGPRTRGRWTYESTAGKEGCLSLPIAPHRSPQAVPDD